VELGRALRIEQPADGCRADDLLHRDRPRGERDDEGKYRSVARADLVPMGRPVHGGPSR
jgi:hypothetical protein